MRKCIPAISLIALGCGEVAPAVPEAVTVVPQVKLMAELGTEFRFSARVADIHGVTIPGTAVSWSVTDPQVASVSASGEVTALAHGRTEVVATVEGVRGSASLEVHVPPEISEYVPGESYFGRRRYVEYIAGDLPLVVSAGHGGGVEPGEIPRRSYGNLGRDRGTLELARHLADSVFVHTGRHPHLIISRLRRTRLDPNREIVEAAQGNEFAEQAWREYHRFIVQARDRIAQDYGEGFYVDLHGHSHPVAQVELGYLLTAADLNRSDRQLDEPRFREKSSIRSLAGRTGVSFSTLVRGPGSFGAMLSEERVPVVPSPLVPGPGDEPFWSGGYSTRRHGSLGGGRVDGVQIELHYPGMRDTADHRRRTAGILARTLMRFLEIHYELAVPS